MILFRIFRLSKNNEPEIPSRASRREEVAPGGRWNRWKGDLEDQKIIKVSCSTIVYSKAGKSIVFFIIINVRKPNKT
jgi:hypothetical protein